MTIRDLLVLEGIDLDDEIQVYVSESQGYATPKYVRSGYISWDGKFYSDAELDELQVNAYTSVLRLD